MDHLLTGSEIKLTYLRDRLALAEIDWPAILDDLTDAGAPPNLCHWSDLDGLTHVVLAIDRSTGRHVGMLGLAERTTTREPYLAIEAAMVPPGEQEGSLRRTMLAHALARIVCLDGKPVAIASPHRGGMEPALRDLGAQIGFAGFHPPAGGNVIEFASASLARRIGSGGTVLDLRPVREASLLDDLRAMHRVRPRRVRRAACEPAAIAAPMSEAAMHGVAKKRPGRATRTGNG